MSKLAKIVIVVAALAIPALALAHGAGCPCGDGCPCGPDCPCGSDCPC